MKFANFPFFVQSPSVTVAIFSAILVWVANPSQHQNNSPESKVPISSIGKLEK